VVTLFSSGPPSSQTLCDFHRSLRLPLQYEGEQGEQKTIPHWEYGECLAFMDMPMLKQYQLAWHVANNFTTKVETFQPTIANRGGPKSKNTFAQLMKHHTQGNC